MSEDLKQRFYISTDKSKLDIFMIHDFIKNSYWAENIPLAIVEKSIKNSLCFGVYEDNKQVGFARVISDYATTAYLKDVFILEPYRGQGLGKWFVSFYIGISRTARCAKMVVRHKRCSWTLSPLRF